MISNLAEWEINNLYLASVSSDNQVRTKILSLQHKLEWKSYLNKLPESMQDVYYSPEYYELYEKNGDGKAFCFVMEDGNRLALYPFLLNRINDLGYELNELYYDIQGAYGYNGVVYSSDDIEFINLFYGEFGKFCKNNRIVVEFTRFHPLLRNHRVSENFLEISKNRQTVYVNLMQSYDKIYENFTKSAQRNWNKAIKNNLSVFIYENEFPYKKEFIKMYNDNMRRVNADSYLYFNDAYFENLLKQLQVIQFVALKDGLPVASALCFYNNFNLHYHMGASKLKYLSLKPNNILFVEMIKYGIEKGFKTLHLGGGKTSYEEDSLLRFKKNFSKQLVDYYVGKKIHSNKIYNIVLKQWYTNYPNLIDKYKGILLKYRYFE